MIVVVDFFFYIKFLFLNFKFILFYILYASFKVTAIRISIKIPLRIKRTSAFQVAQFSKILMPSNGRPSHV